METPKRIFVRADNRKATTIEKRLEAALKNVRRSGMNKAGAFDSAFQKLPKAH